MPDLSAPFAPDWVSPPGDTILDLLEERGWTQAELATRLGYSTKHVNQLVKGKVPLTDDAAVRLERVLGSPVCFWLTREARYRERLARLKSQQKQEAWISWLDELPVRDLMAMESIPKQRINKKSKPSIVGDLLGFFGVATPNEWRAHYGQMQLSFRRTRAEQSDVGAIASWLRLGEQKAEMLDCPAYDRLRFKEVLIQIRKLTVLPPEEFEPRLKSLLFEAGVTFVLVPAIRRAHVSGVARWLSTSRPMMQLSLYGKTNDRFWFTFFHEAAHILLHANTKEEKRSVFLDDPNAGHTDDPTEHEANRWASEWLIPSEFAEVLPGLHDINSIAGFSREIGIHPGIVLGRLQHEGYVPFATPLNKLKMSFCFNKSDNS